MMKTYYTRPELEVVFFCGDVITDSKVDEGVVDGDSVPENPKDFG